MIDRLKGLFGLAAVLAVSGCSALNPYDENSRCPAYDDYGTCVSVSQAYEHARTDQNDIEVPLESLDVYENQIGVEDETDTESTDAIPLWEEDDPLGIKQTAKAPTAPKKVAAPRARKADKDELNYRRQLYRETATLLKAPKTPMVRPPTVRRILIMSYEDDDVLYMPRYVYIMVDRGGWVLDEIDDPRKQDSYLELFGDIEK